ncbi:MAG: tetratricopeptide repeat protein, partial [Blastocatellia bacterium]
ARLLLLIELYYNPASAVTRIRTLSPLITGGLLAAVSSFIYDGLFNGNLAAVKYLFASPDPSMILGPLTHRALGAFYPVLFLAAIFTPVAILVASVIDHRSSFRVLFKQEYAPLASCIFYAWAAAHLIMLAPSWLLLGGPMEPGSPLLAPVLRLSLSLAPVPYFLFLAVLSGHIVLRQSYLGSVGAMLLASCSLIALPLASSFGFIFSSPFLLIIAILFLRGFITDVLSVQRDRERFKQNLEASTLNPADSSAHYNLGLIYQQHGQVEEARKSFERAIEIAPDETDAHYQLGRLAREGGRLVDAIRHFDAAVSQNQEHSQNEVWREIGRTYFQAGQYEDARVALERFLEKRPTDAEGR